jgi:hypothetical protein
VGPGEALFVGPSALDVARYVDGQVSIEPAGVSVLDGVNGVGRSATYGSLIVTNIGDVHYEVRPRSWTKLVTSNVPEAKYVYEIEGRLLVAGTSRIAEIGGDGQACENALAFSGSANRAVLAGPRRLILMTDASDEPPVVRFVRFTPSETELCTEP